MQAAVGIARVERANEAIKQLLVRAVSGGILVQAHECLVLPLVDLRFQPVNSQVNGGSPTGNVKENPIVATVHGHALFHLAVHLFYSKLCCRRNFSVTVQIKRVTPESTDHY